MAMLRAQGYDGDRAHVLMVGDRIDTDVRIGRRNGWSTCLVESGCHTEADLATFPGTSTDLVAKDVDALVTLPRASARQIVLETLRELWHLAPGSGASGRTGCAHAW